MKRIILIMSTTDEEKEMIIREAADSIYLDIILSGHMTKDEVLDLIDTLLTERGA